MVKKPEVEMAEDHWRWLSGVLNRTKATFDMEAVRYIYETAFTHGFKHGLDYAAKHTLTRFKTR